MEFLVSSFMPGRGRWEVLYESALIQSDKGRSVQAGNQKKKL